MLTLLPGDELRVGTTVAVPVHVHVSYVDWDPNANAGQGKGTPGRAPNVILNTVGTTSVLSGPGAGLMRNVKLFTTRAPTGNGSAVEVIPKHYDGSTLVEMKGKTLQPGEELHYCDQHGFLDL